MNRIHIYMKMQRPFQPSLHSNNSDLREGITTSLSRSSLSRRLSAALQFSEELKHFHWQALKISMRSGIRYSLSIDVIDDFELCSENRKRPWDSKLLNNEFSQPNASGPPPLSHCHLKGSRFFRFPTRIVTSCSCLKITSILRKADGHVTWQLTSCLLNVDRRVNVK